MKTLTALASALLCWAAAGGTNAVSRVALPDVPQIVLEGEHSGHLQDVWYDGHGHLYWSVTRSIAKTDLTGRILAQSEYIDDHQGGLEVRNGRLYTAACMQHKKCGGKTTPECRVTVREYDAETLKPIAAHVTDINDRAGSLAILDDGTYVVGCLRPQDLQDAQVRFHHLDRNFKLIKTYVLDNVPVLLGIEVIKKKGQFLYLCLYGVGKNQRKLDFNCIKLDSAFREVGRGWLTGSVGLVFDGDDVWIGKTEKNKETKKFKNALHRVDARKVRAIVTKGP